MRRPIGIVLAAFAAALVVGTLPAAAAGPYTLSGDATLVAGHNSPTGVQLRSTATTAGAISFAVPAGTTLADINTLAADYQITTGDCGGGAPRFSIETASGNAFVYIGPAPSYTGCTTGSWQSTGNLAGSGFIDTSQLGGTFYDTWQSAVAAFGNKQVTAIDVVVDAGWTSSGTQTVVFDNVNINGTVYTFESASNCKNDGWQTIYGSTFKNQGDCVSYFATGGTNAPSGS